MTESLAVPTAAPLDAAVEQALVNGNLAGLSAPQRVMLYNQVCDSLGLNKYTVPFQYITLNGKLTLYATRNCTDQLRATRGITLQVLWRERSADDLYIVAVRARTRDGREDEEIGAMPIANLKGEALANAIMKAMTKAKRRATLSIVGLSMMDESEVDSIPGAIIEPMSPAVERAMDRFHAALPPSEAVEMPSTVTPEPEKVAARPFVDSGRTEPARTPAPEPLKTPVSGSESPSPSQPKESSTHQKMNKQQLLQAIQANLSRLSDGDFDVELHLIKRMFGEDFTGFSMVMQLPPVNLRPALAKLEPMVKEQPPDPTEVSVASTPSEGDTSASGKEDVPTRPFVDSSAQGQTAHPSAASIAAPTPAPKSVYGKESLAEGEGKSTSEEDVPHFPPPDGNQENPVANGNQSGPIQDAAHDSQEGERLSNPSQGDDRSAQVDSVSKSGPQNQCAEFNAGIRCVRESMHGGNHYFTGPRPEDRPATGNAVTPPDAPTLINGHVSVGDVRALDLYAVMCEHRDIFDRMTAELPWNRKEAAPMITLENWEAIIDAIQENAEVRS